VTFELLPTLKTSINKGVVKIKINLFPIFDQKKMTFDKNYLFFKACCRQAQTFKHPDIQNFKLV
jgi:hypothetical protein